MSTSRIRVQEANTCFRAPRLTALEDDLDLGVVDKDIAFDPSSRSTCTDMQLKLDMVTYIPGHCSVIGCRTYSW
jgi:hypothetical protein